MPPIDPALLERAFALAERGRYSSSPNPMVGAVVVREGRVVGEAYHRRAGGRTPRSSPSARRPRGARRRPLPDARAVRARGPHAALRAGGRRLRRGARVVAARDPNPRVSGPRARALRRAGVGVVQAPRAWRRRAAELNERFRTWIVGGAARSSWPSGPRPRRTDGRGVGGEPLDHGRGRRAGARCAARGVRRGAGGRGNRARRRPAADPAARPQPRDRALADRPRRAPARSGGRAGLPRPGRTARRDGRAPLHPKARGCSARGVEVWSLPARGRERPGGSAAAPLARWPAAGSRASWWKAAPRRCGASSRGGSWIASPSSSRRAFSAGGRARRRRRQRVSRSRDAADSGRARRDRRRRLLVTGRVARGRRALGNRCPMFTGIVRARPRRRGREAPGRGAARDRAVPRRDVSRGRERLRLGRLPDRRAERAAARRGPLRRDAAALDARDARAAATGQPRAGAAMGRPAVGPLRPGARRRRRAGPVGPPAGNSWNSASRFRAGSPGSSPRRAPSRSTA